MGIRARYRTRSNRARRFKDGHCVFQTLVASGLGATRETGVQREIVYVAICWGGRICDGLRVAVCAIGWIFETGCSVESGVGKETQTGLCDERIGGEEINGAGVGGGDVGGERRHEI